MYTSIMCIYTSYFYECFELICMHIQLQEKVNFCTQARDINTMDSYIFLPKCHYSSCIRPESIMLQNLPIMFFAISLIFAY